VLSLASARADAIDFVASPARCRYYMLVAAHQNLRAEEMGPQAVSVRRDSASLGPQQLSKNALNFTLADL
jgi:hypothetical protein